MSIYQFRYIVLSIRSYKLRSLRRGVLHPEKLMLVVSEEGSCVALDIQLSKESKVCINSFWT